VPLTGLDEREEHPHGDGRASENDAILGRAPGHAHRWLESSVWHGRSVIRFSVSSWRTGTREVLDAVAAVGRAAGVPVGSHSAKGEWSM
jgi:hypothetical protein